MTLIFRGEIASGRGTRSRSLRFISRSFTAHMPFSLADTTSVCAVGFWEPPCGGCSVTPSRPCIKIREALALAQELPHPHTTVVALTWAAIVKRRRENPSLKQPDRPVAPE
jgi:hypothetical protein